MRSGAALDTLTRVLGVRVGHASDRVAGTGVTVIRFDRAAPTVVSILGGASATYDTGSLSLESTFGRRWAVFFSGGSLFGLDAARGVRSELLSDGDGHTVFRNPRRVAPVTGATLFDLPDSDAPLPDYAVLGGRATRAAGRGAVPMGRVGAGLGALVGKYQGRGRAMAGGVGSAAIRVPRLGWVGALAVVNAVGAVRSAANGEWVAGARDAKGRVVPPDPGRWGRRGSTRTATGTTLVAVVTNQPFTRAELARVAAVASTGISDAIVPAFTATDGDVLFCSTTGEGARPVRDRYPGARVDHVGLAAARAVATAIVRAIPVDGQSP